MYLKSITAGAVDITEYCLQEATEISLSTGGRMATARLTASANPSTSPPPPIPSAQDALVITGNVQPDCDQCAVNGDFEDGLTGWELFNTVEEGDGLNLLLRSEDLSVTGVWGQENGATMTGANQIDFAASADARRLQNITDQAPLNSKTFTITARIRCASGTQLARLEFIHQGVAFHTSSDFTITTAAQDFTFTQTLTNNAGNGTLTPAIRNGTDGAARSIIVERVQVAQAAAAVPYERGGAARPICARIPSNQGIQAGPSQLFRCDPYQVVTVTAQVRPSTNGTHYQIIGFQDAAGGDLGVYFSTAITPGSAWVEATFSATAPAKTFQVSVYPAFLEDDATTGEFDVDAVEVAIADRTIFRGTITRVEPQIVTPSQVRYTIAAQDNTRLLDTIVVASEEHASQTDEAILDNLMATYSGSPPAITTTNVIATSPPTVLDTILFENLTLRRCIERIAERTGKEWYVDFDGDLHYFELGQVEGVFDFSDEATGNAETFPLISGFGYQEEFSSPANVVTVNGYQEPQGADVAVTQAVAASGDDGSVYALDSVWKPSGGTITGDATGDPAFIYYQVVAGFYVYGQFLVRFNTAVIPDDAEVVSATLTLWLKRSAEWGTETFPLQFGADYHSFTSITSAEYQDAPDYTPDAVPFWPIRQLPELVFTERAMPLTNLSSINKAGYTGFRAYLTQGSGITPNANFTLQVNTFDATDSNRVPKLTVTYRPARAAQIVGSYTDTVSVALYGEFQRTINDEGVKSVGEAEARAQTETALFGYPIKSINVSFDRDGLNVGDTVHFTSRLLNIDDDFVVKSLRMRWPGGPELTRYSAELGQFRPDLIDFLRKRG